MFIQNTTLPNIMLFIYLLDGGKMDDFEFEQHLIEDKIDIR